MAEKSSQEKVAPRFVEMPKAVRLDVVKSEDGVAIDFTYQPLDKSDPITMRLPLSLEDARQLANMLSSSSRPH